nr:hypothetical protein [Tanacetum cinerariifolium]
SQQAATKNKEKVIVNSCTPTYDQEPPMVADDDEIANQDNTLRINKGTRYDNQRAVNVVVAWKNVVYHKEKMLLCKQKDAGFQQNAKQADWRDDTDDEHEDQESEAYYLYVAHFQEVTPDATDDPGPIFDVEPLQKVQNDDDKFNVFANEKEHPEQPESFNDTYPDEQDEHNIIINSLDMSHDREQDDQDDDDDIAKEHDLLASLIEKLKCDIDDNKNRNKLFESSNDTLVDKLKESQKSLNEHTRKINDLNQTIS